MHQPKLQKENKTTSNGGNIAILLAAGGSTRIRPINKMFYRIKGRPLLLYTILVLEKHPEIQKIILVARESDFPKIISLVKKYNLKKLAIIIEGGKKRQDSAFNGLKAATKIGAKKGDLILFHNGANPLVSSEEISEIIRITKKHKAALIGHFARDTVKETDNRGFVSRTIDRKKIFLAQTPQVIEYNLAKRAFEKAKKDKFYGTDDVSLVERMGLKVKVVPGGLHNIKVTFAADLDFVKFLLEK